MLQRLARSGLGTIHQPVVHILTRTKRTTPVSILRRPNDNASFKSTRLKAKRRWPQTAAEIAQTEGTVSPKKFQAEMLRSALGSTLDDREFSKGTIQLKKGDVFLVEKQTYSDVVLAKRGERFRVAKNEVRLTEANPSTETEAYGESLRILSAKYDRPNNRQYEVKEEIKKRLPEGALLAPVEILVSDALLRSRAGYMVQTGVLQGNVVTMQKDVLCILTITYEQNGQSFKKEVLEGNTLVLP